MKNRFAAITLLMLFATILIIYYNMHSIHPTRVRISTTTSLYATGLLDYIAVKFRELYPDVEIQFIPVGSSAALRYAERGDVCAVFVHEPNFEKKYLDMGVIEEQKIFAFNYFIIVGPREDPANISMAIDVVDAFRRIYSAERESTYFISRGDGSGTHTREIYIWKLAGISPTDRPWYKECGCGMDQALIIANELKGYTLSDVGTYMVLKIRGRIPNIEALYNSSTDIVLLNIYSGYLAKGCRGIERRYAELFLNFIYSNPDIVDNFGVNEYGVRLFYSARHFDGDIRDLWSKLAGIG